MTTTNDRRDIERDIAKTRERIHDDLAALEEAMHPDFPVPAIVGSAAALGLLVGLGGKRGIKSAFAVSAIVAAGAMMMKRR